MAKIDITKTELVWPGKYSDDGMRKEVPQVTRRFRFLLGDPFRRRCLRNLDPNDSLPQLCKEALDTPRREPARGTDSVREGRRSRRALCPLWSEQPGLCLTLQASTSRS